MGRSVVLGVLATVRAGRGGRGVAASAGSTAGTCRNGERRASSCMCVVNRSGDETEVILERNKYEGRVDH